MACPPPLAGIEKRLGEILNGTRRWIILGNTLSLKDKNDNELALFEAVYF
jgi:heat shock protein HslJ